MAQERVRSTAVSFAEYNELTGVLIISYSDGTRYAYFGVPREIYTGFMQAGSKGKLLNAMIRGTYPFRRVG